MRKYDPRGLLERVNLIQAFRLASPAVNTSVGATPVVIDDTSIGVAAITGFLAADPVLLVGQNGDGDLVTLGTPSGTSLPTAQPIKVPAKSGSKVYRMTATDLGDFAGGVQFTGGSTLNRVYGSIGRTPLTSFVTQGQMGGGVKLRDWSPEALQFAFGHPETTSGNGAAATPWSGAVRGAKIGTEGLMVIRASGVMDDGVTIFTFDWVNAKIAAQINTTLGGGSDTATIDVTWDATCLVYRDSDH